ncbi:hypothetical protein KL918_003047 [Ogataea parapolymorpha]|nr:hypothetical protein KL918_003047 [Ogataea parapolymorpha]
MSERLHAFADFLDTDEPLKQILGTLHELAGPQSQHSVAPLPIENHSSFVHDDPFFFQMFYAKEGGHHDQHVAADAEFFVRLGAVAQHRRDHRKTQTHANLAKCLQHARHKPAHVGVRCADQHAQGMREEKAAARGRERLHGHNPPPVEVAVATVPCGTECCRGHDPRVAQHERGVWRQNIVFHGQQRRHGHHADQVWGQLDCG